MQIMNTKIRGEYPAPNNVILSRAVQLTARGMQIQNIFVAQITIQDDCTLLVDFLVDVTAQISAGCSPAAITAHAQARLVSQGVPLTAQRLLGVEDICHDATGQTAVRIQCHLFVEPQQCPLTASYLGLTLLLYPRKLEVKVSSYRPLGGDRVDCLSFLNHNLFFRTAAEFLRDLYLQFPWYQQWLLKDAYCQTGPVADGKSFRVTYQPFKYGFGTFRAPACNVGDLGDLLFTNAVRPAMFTC